MASMNLVAALISASLFSGCSKVVKWQEEVLLNDGQILVVSQTRTCAGGNTESKTLATCVAMDASMSFRYPPLSRQEIAWQGHLHPLVLNIDAKRLFLIGFPIHPKEFLEYGSPAPPYVGFVWSDGGWKQILFGDISASIYATNLLMESIPKTGRDFISLSLKDSAAENGDQRYPSYLKHVDPKHRKKTL